MHPLLSNNETNPGREFARLCVIPELGGMYCLRAHFPGHRFAPHVHDNYVIALIGRGERPRANIQDPLQAKP